MKSKGFLVLLVCVSMMSLRAQPTVQPEGEGLAYYLRHDFLLASPGAMKFGLYGYTNPSLLSTLHRPDLLFIWSDRRSNRGDFSRWGIFAGVPHLGFGVVRQKVGGFSVSDYQLSVSLGNRTFSYGLGYGWSGGDVSFFGRMNLFKLGFLFRPNRYVSLGTTGSQATGGNDKDVAFELAARPFGNELLTFFGDVAFEKMGSINNEGWSAGAALEFLPGIRVATRYFDTEAFTLGIEFSLGNIGASTQAHLGERSQHHNTYGVRLGAYDRNIFRSDVIPKRDYLKVDMTGKVKYQRFILFDDTNTLLSLLSAIDAAKNDPSIGGIAVNTSGMNVNKVMLWELREKLKDFKSTGKHVIVFIDRSTIREYHFASVADKIVLDPTGMVILEGFVMGRTFLKGTLEKLGIGFDEWRFFKYKSAAETFSRDDMSDADREQRQALVDGFYKLARLDISEARGLAPDEFDRLVDETTIFLPQQALEEGLVDTIGRWGAVEDMISQLEGEQRGFVGEGSLAKFRLPKDNAWSEDPRIAVVYAIGPTAMDRGIKARELVKDVEAVTRDSRVKAVVLRVDSPGGDGTAADIIAEAIMKCKKEKPVIVSQGAVAASGGYWLSMYADTIVAAPNTITGSIGVIGGWFYDKGLKEKLGMSTDFVKKGEHADIGFGFVMPFVGIGLPDRNLTSDERGKIESAIGTFYEGFVEKVAAGREKSFDEIDAIAQGRVWSGYEAKQIGLVDVLGGLATAIKIAKEKATIPEHQDVEIVEYPKMGLIDPSIFISKLFGVEVADDKNELLEYLKLRLKHNGQPMPILPLDMMDFGKEWEN